MLRGVLLAVGALIGLCGLSFLAALVVEVANGGDGKTEPGVYAALIIVTLGACAIGGFLVWQAVARRPSPDAAPVAGRPTANPASAGRPTPESAAPGVSDSDAERERRILQFAEEEHGRVTLPEVALHCNVTVVQAKSDLDRLVAQQVAELLVTESGVLVYVFRGFLSDDEKASAKDF